MGCPSGLRSIIGNDVGDKPSQVRILSPPQIIMRIIFLNVDQGRTEDKLFGFIKRNSQHTDIFCFQELNKTKIDKIKKVLHGFNFIYHSKGDWKYKTRIINYGQGLFVKNEKMQVQSAHSINTYKGTNREPQCFTQLIEIRNGSGNFVIANIHGKVFPGNKLDTPTRILQSKKIIKSLENIKHPKIIGGDFNLLPNTKSIEIFEGDGYRNLIKEYKISTTRNKIAWERFSNREKQYFADYVFISPEIKVSKFEVPNVEISDHLPLVLDFEI